MPLIISKATKTMLVPRNGQTITMFPGARELKLADQDHLLVPHGHREFLIMNRLGHQVPNPILSYYDFAGALNSPRPPFSSQKATCASMTAYPRSYVLNDMGTGKTKAALWAWDYLRSNGLCGKLLVVGPLSTLNFVWAREVFATLPHRKAVVLHGPKKQRLERLNDLSADIYIINHDGLRVVEKELSARTDIDVLVLDELAVYRNNSDRSKHMRKFAERFPWVWGMTGKPLPNEVTDVWAQVKIVTPERAPKWFKQAREMLCTKINQYKYAPKKDAVEQAFNMMKPHVRYRLDDVTELPDLVMRWIDVPLSEEQAKLYKKMAGQFQIMVKNKVITAANAAAAMSKLLQVSCGYVYTTAPEFVSIPSAPRQDELINVLQGVEGKTLVFVPFRHTIEGLSKLLTGDPAEPDKAIEHCIVHGDVTNRDHIFNLFQNTDKYPVMLAHPACLAHGITLTAARTIIWYGPIASLDIYEQANARIRRVGQKFKQQVLHFQSTPVERKFYKLLAGKQNIQNQLLEMFETSTMESAS